MFEKFLTSDTVKQWAFAAIRHGVAVATPTLIAAGVLQPTQTNDLLGCALFLAAMGWSWWQKHNQQKEITALKG